MPVLHSEEQLLRSESLSLKSLVPEYGIGDCYPASVMGWSRWLDALLEGDDPERYWRTFDQLTYCQGWYLRRWSDGAIDGFPHGFLIDTTAAADGQPCIIDPIHLLYGTRHEAFWLPVQTMSWPQLDRWFESTSTVKAWPLTTRPGGNELEDRLSYKRALTNALTALEVC